MFVDAFQILALTPSASSDPAIAIAACRAGALGILNLEYSQDVADIYSLINKVQKYTANPFGVKLGHLPAASVIELVKSFPAQVEVLILTTRIHALAGPNIAKNSHKELSIIVEVTDVQQAVKAVESGAAGLIAKGNEASGWVGEETTFVLLQRLLNRFDLPIFANGGIGLHSAAACYVAGAAGVVLESQLALTKESKLPTHVKNAIANMDGSETALIGQDSGLPCRAYNYPRATAFQRIIAAEQELMPAGTAKNLSEWQDTVIRQIGWGSLQDNLWPLDQAACFAASLADRFHTVSGILQGMQSAIKEHLQIAVTSRTLDSGSPLANALGTRYPVIQGPMTRVSDRAEFARDVADSGGLPFLALALLRAPQVDELLSKTSESLAEQPWGVGILGFVPRELREEQLAVIQRHKPPFALIAGGRPDQAKALEDQGTQTYLHVPSPGLLHLFWAEGARRFVFEGRECGGHVGPRSSFVLWNSMVNALCHELQHETDTECCVLFAGGIHDRRSAAMVSALAAPLIERGVKIGVLMGTAYLFTHEAVSSGSIVKGFQNEALHCQETVLLESGPGHATRCAPTIFAGTFQQEKQQLTQSGGSAEEMRQRLEELNIGRLRIASKGIVRNIDAEQSEGASKYLKIELDTQHRDGLYMLGQVAALHDTTFSIADLHEEVAIGSTQYLEQLTPDLEDHNDASVAPSRIAIVGISTLLPGAQNLTQFWTNILDKVSAIKTVPNERWNAGLYLDPERQSRDKIYSSAGGFLDDVAFDPLEFGIPPNSLSSIDPMHLLALLAARDVIDDAGYRDRPFDRSRTSVILGASGGTGDLGSRYLLRAGLPSLFGEEGFELAHQAGDLLPTWTEDSFAGLLLNVAAGRIANRFDFGGTNYVVDAACASSLTAVHLAVKELETHSTDIVITGGVDTVQTPFGYLCFSNTQALSPSGEPRVFDASGDGIVISEGIVMLMLKRLEDAERDGDRIYAVISSVAGSSDGKAMGMTAPRPEGQALALKRAYVKAGFSPTTVKLFEAHGTGTVVGDRTEANALADFLTQANARSQNHAIGSVKSMIGHTKATAGVAGMAKVAAALYNKVLPPTLGVSKPNPKAGFGDGPLYVNSEARPWLQSDQAHPRRAAVSAFGFGGTNFHAVLEEYTGHYLTNQDRSALYQWPSQIFLWSAADNDELATQCEWLLNIIAAHPDLLLQDLAYTLWQEVSKGQNADSAVRLAIVADSSAELQSKLSSIVGLLRSGQSHQVYDGKGIYLASTGEVINGSIAFLFPGQGSQYPSMLSELAMHFPEVSETFERFDRTLRAHAKMTVSEHIFPVPAFTPEEQRIQKKALTNTETAQPAIGASSLAIVNLLNSFGVLPHMVGGHSYGEYPALYAAGAIEFDTLALLSVQRGECIASTTQDSPGTMAAIWSTPAIIEPIIAAIEDVWIANINSPKQTILAGSSAGIAHALTAIQERSINGSPIPVAYAFHSPLMEPAQGQLTNVLLQTTFDSPHIDVYSNTTASIYPKEPEAIAAQLSTHLLNPVRFVDEIEAMYADGARIFIEVGPNNVLSNLVDQILEKSPHIAVPVDRLGRNGLTQLQHALGQLWVNNVSVAFERLYAGQKFQFIDLKALASADSKIASTHSRWLVNGSQVKPPQTQHASSDTDRQKETERSFHQTSLNGVSRKANATPKIVFKSKGAAFEVPSAKENAPRNSMDAHRQNIYTDQRAMNNISSANSLPNASLNTENPSTATSSSNEVAAAMNQFHSVMERFIDTQKSVMLTYLNNRSNWENGVKQQTLQPDKEVVPILPAQYLSGQIDDAQRESTHRILHNQHLRSEHSQIATTENGTHTETAPPLSTSPDQDRQDLPDLLSRDALTARLLDVVSERTGYPSDMLDLTVDVEANLGIDSIKRVEILGILQRDYIPADSQIKSEAMEELTSIRTLGGIADWLLTAIQDQDPQEKKNHLNELREEEQSTVLSSLPLLSQQPAAPHPTNGLSHEPTIDASYLLEDEVALTRMILRRVDAPAIENAESNFAQTDLIIITADVNGLAYQLSKRIQTVGGRAVVIGDITNHPTMSETYQTDLADATTLIKTLHEIQTQHGPIGSVIHLAPLNVRPDYELTDPPGWQTDIERDIKSFFHCAQIAIRQPNDNSVRNAWFIAASGSQKNAASEVDSAEGNAPNIPPTQGALRGFIKSLAQEQPSATCKIIHFAKSNPKDECVDIIMKEMAASDNLVEVGYSAGRRWTYRATPLPFEPSGKRSLSITSEWVLLLTGGARGITAEIAYFLAKTYQPTLVLIGRSELPDTEEPSAITGLVSEAEIKAALINEIRKTTGHVDLGEVEKQFSQLMKAREMRTTMRKIQQTGAQVHYFAADVRDPQEMTKIIDQIYAEQGRLDGIVHGAGLIEDKLLKDKTIDSFDRVFDTKVAGAFNLIQAVRPETLSFLAFLTSAAGAFGNRGQSDYAAANALLNQLSSYLDQHWSTRVVALNWGPWLKAGMVSDALQNEFAKRQIQLIPVDEGCRAFDRELCYGQKGDADIIYAGGAWEENTPLQRGGHRMPQDTLFEAVDQSVLTQSARPFPLLQASSVEFIQQEEDESLEIIRHFDSTRDLYLRDHELEGSMVVPLAIALELMAEVAQTLQPDFQLSGVRDLQLLGGIVLDEDPKAVRVRAVQHQSGKSVNGILSIQTVIEDPESSRTHYRATIELTSANHRRPANQPRYAVTDLGLSPFPLSVIESYQKWLFHGPCFQGIQQIHGISERDLLADCRSVGMDQCFGDVPSAEWLIDPILFDSALQMIILWSRHFSNKTPLPAGFKQYHRFGALSEAVTCHLQVLSNPNDLLFRGNIAFIDKNGQMLGLLESMECPTSETLNRLSIVA